MKYSLDQLQDTIVQMNTNLTGDYEARPDNVYLEGNEENRQIIGGLIDNLMLPGSCIQGIDNLKKLSDFSEAGESCLLLAEHYSNFDYPILYRLTENTETLGKEVAQRFLPIQGMKLSEGNPVTAVFSNSYNTIVIYPSRSIDNETDPEKKAAIRKVSLPINHAAMKELTHRKYHGNIIVVFPSGTRYRPWDPESKKGVREIYTYLKAFDHICFVSINGNMLQPSESNDMAKDTVAKDLMYLKISEPIRGKDFIKNEVSHCPEGTDTKQYVVDQVMKQLDLFHEEVEPVRQEKLKQMS